MLKTQNLAIPSICTTPEEYDSYKFTLAPKYKEAAKEELREDEAIRTHALAQLRDWIAKHPHIKRCRTDAVFLLRFLRTKKFSVQPACEMLEKYLAVRQLFPQWFMNLDPEDPAIDEIIDSGYLFPLPQRDEHGRRILFSCASHFDANKFTSAQMARTHSLVCEYLMDEEESQIAGYTYITDEGGLTMSHVSLWSFIDLRNMLKCIQNSTPMRHKETHFINIPHYANKVIEFALNIISEKLKKRVFLDKNLDELTSRVDKKLLPKEYGGEIPMADIIRDFKQDLKKFRDKILYLDDMYIEITKSPTNWIGNDDSDIETGVIGSFRKLEVD